MPWETAALATSSARNASASATVKLNLPAIVGSTSSIVLVAADVVAVVDVGLIVVVSLVVGTGELSIGASFLSSEHPERNNDSVARKKHSMNILP